MGQTCTAIVYGVALDDHVLDWFRVEQGWRWDDPQRAGHDPLPVADLPETGYESDFVGFSVASEHPDNGEDEFDVAVAIDEIPVRFEDGLARAKARWDKLAAWLADDGVDVAKIPPPRLLLAVVERA